jgi:two-component sensor histidine kinase
VALACRAGDEDGASVVEWVERGGPPIAEPPARRGFGLRLLEHGLSMQAGMAADLRFESEGLRCVLRLPAR